MGFRKTVDCPVCGERMKCESLDHKAALLRRGGAWPKPVKPVDIETNKPDKKQK